MAINNGHDSRKFITEITSEVDAGFGFVPLIGTGVSAHSGVPIVSQIEDYLRKCLWLAMPVDHGPTALADSDPRTDPTLDRPWNPRTDCWPPLDASEFMRWDGEERLRSLLHDRRLKTP